MNNDSQIIMAIGAHHDDNELVAGTLALHKQAGWQVVSVVMTDGRCIDGIAADEHVTIRDRESQAAAKLVGSETVFLRFREGGGFEPSTSVCNVLVRMLRQYKPQIVITHPPCDYHRDHINTSNTVLDAVLVCNSIAFDCDLPPCLMPKLYYSDAYFTPFEPDEYVDISDVIDLKLQALGCHQSQLPPAEANADNIVEFAKHQSRTRGIEAGIKYAESFRLVPQLGLVRLSKLLGST